MLSRSPFIEVVGTARDGRDALEQVEKFKPDVVTLDLIMPNLDGVGFLREQMKRAPLPVVVCSIASESGELALKALDEGAVDFIQKPTALATEKVFEISDEIIEKVKAAADVPMTRLVPAPAPPTLVPAAPARKGLFDIVVIGISTGGPQALKMLVPQFPADFPVPIAIVLHMPVGYTELYAQKLDEISRLRVVEAKEGEAVKPGVVFIAPAGRHLTFARTSEDRIVTHLDARPFDTPHRPSVDVLFQSAADVYGSRVLGVVMTGMGADGKQGAAWIKAQGGTIFTEDESTCVVYGMPRSVVEAGLSDRVVSLDRMAQAILEAI
jgi:two-component system chemotaxis response regulator CheB